MSPKYLPLCLLIVLGLVLLATTSLADLQDRRLPPIIVRPPFGKKPPSVEESTKETIEATTRDGKAPVYKPPKGHRPPNTQNESSKFEHTTVEDGYKPPHKPSKKHPLSKN
ncbi:hypothetical protein E2542_SST25255 [Spatholobus suberectus]|nr:hypothetical protein E2542_SST25255 [Spatholobus suberectus]